MLSFEVSDTEIITAFDKFEVGLSRFQARGIFPSFPFEVKIIIVPDGGLSSFVA